MQVTYLLRAYIVASVVAKDTVLLIACRKDDETKQQPPTAQRGVTATDAR